MSVIILDTRRNGPDSIYIPGKRTNSYFYCNYTYTRHPNAQLVEKQQPRKNKRPNRIVPNSYQRNNNMKIELKPELSLGYNITWDGLQARIMQSNNIEREEERRIAYMYEYCKHFNPHPDEFI